MRQSLNWACKHGLPLRTLDRHSFLVLNGVQTMSNSCVVLLDDLAPLMEAGLTRVRLSPQYCDMVSVTALHRATLDGRNERKEARRGLGKAYPGIRFSNGFLHQQEGAAWVARGRSATAAGR